MRQMVHVTTRERLDAIRDQGLLPDAPVAHPGWRDAGEHFTVLDCYGRRPIYLADPRRPATYPGCVALLVDVQGLELYPDLPMLFDLGFHADDLGGIDFDEELAPELLAAVVPHASDYGDGEYGIGWEDLKREPLRSTLIGLTGSACVLEAVAPARVSARVYHEQEIDQLVVDFAAQEPDPAQGPALAPLIEMTGATAMSREHSLEIEGL